MKKTLIALAAVAATGAAFAQSTVTLYGVVDTGFRSATAGDNKFQGMANGSNLTSRLGFKGTEDLGAGLKANFVMEGDLAPNDGTNAGFKFLRQSTIGVQGNFGEVRLGRDYTPAFRVFGIVDPFGTVGVGSAGNILWSTVVDTTRVEAAEIPNDGTFTAKGAAVTATGATGPAAISTQRLTVADPNVVRANNSFAYYSPNFNGFSGSLMVSTGAQNAYSLKKQGDMTGLSLNYANGPLVVAYANQVTKGGVTQTAAITGSENQKFTTDFLAGSYDLGVVKAGLGYRTEKLAGLGSDLKSKAMIYGVTAPMGAVTLKASYITKKTDLGDGSEKAGNQFALGAVYDLSKRTALYATYSQLKNEAGYANNVGSAVASAGGVKAKGYDIGVRHSF